MSRIWYVLSEAVSKHREQTLDESLSTLSPEERETVDPYAQYPQGVGTTRPLLSLLIWGSMGVFALLPGIGLFITNRYGMWYLGFVPLTVVGALIYAARYGAYERKKRQRELYETLLENPRRLLNPDYRSQFDDLVGLDDDGGGREDDAPVDERPAEDDYASSSRSESGSESN